MAYREVTMLEVKEVLRLWLGKCGKRRIARLLNGDVKTVRGYIQAATELGLVREAGEAALTEELISSVLQKRRSSAHRPRGETWQHCEQRRQQIADYLSDGVRLSKVCRLLRRGGVEIPYPTLHRFAVAELGFGSTAATIPVIDCAAGQECQLDTGWVLRLAPDARGRKRRVKAWIFTAVRSRHRFVYPIERETTESGIEACEAAWRYFTGVFAVLIVDNTKAIVQDADPLEPRLNQTFLEYSQARGFVIDTARVRKPRDKGRVERTVAVVRDDCFAGEVLHTIEQGRTHAVRWGLDEYGMRRHSSTGRLPREHFESEEQPALKPAPTDIYDTPLWCEPKVGRDQHVQIAKALYSLPTEYVGRRLKARADRFLVRLYDKGLIVKTHPRMPKGGRSTDPLDFPEHKRAYAMRDIDYLKRQAAQHGASIGQFAERVLDDPLPWTRMRRVYSLLGLIKKYGAERLEDVCTQALAAEMLNVPRLSRMLKLAPVTPPPEAKQLALAMPSRYLRPTADYAIASSAVEG